ncbi:MAG: pirin family protein [Candidatus Cloacimonadaceae bacterium]|nr:pirin family protein [Candidatus Cloacimonadaceae bacterium]
MQPRKIKLIQNASPVLEGAGVHLMRVFGYHQSPLFDPFLMLDDFRNDDPEKYLPGFPWHPHRGIETITYMLEGSAEHGDSLGNSGTIHKGEVQWMTAGSGIIHQEMPKPDENGRMYGFQLWTNLPATQKMTQPRYRDLHAEDMPIYIHDNGASVKIICGNYMGLKGPVEDLYIQPQYWDISLPPDTSLDISTELGFCCFIYAYEGQARIDGSIISNQQAVLFEDGDILKLRACENGFKLLFLLGRPLGEPVSWRGPIVMNSPEEIKQAFAELQNGTFIKHK